MEQVSLSDIANTGRMVEETEAYTIYLTPQSPLSYYKNGWFYHQLPSYAQWCEDIDKQWRAHKSINANHLMFRFPENESLSPEWFEAFRQKGFRLGQLELYAITSKEFIQNYSERSLENVKLLDVQDEHLADYLKIFETFAMPFGKAFAREAVEEVKSCHHRDEVRRVIAYDHTTPVGILDLIEADTTVEIDGFGVLPESQGLGIGTAMQLHIAQCYDDKTIILVADAEDTAKDMYLKQGYRFVSDCYHVVKDPMY